MKPKVRIFLFHTLWGTLLALFLIFIFHFFTDDLGSGYGGIKSIILPLWVIVLINLLFRGLIQLDIRLEKWIPWFFFPKRRLAIEIAVAFPALLIILSLNYLLLRALSDHPVETLSHRQFLYTYIIMVIVLGVAMTMVLATRFFDNWRQSFMEVEQLKQEKMKSDYQALQNQLNPHFLFNNFNMLVAEIRRDRDNAIRITEKLADVYRYVLESKNHETVPLAEEVEFVQAIIFLHQVRFADNLLVNFDLPTDVMEFRLPPLTMQILFENVLKHNVVSVDHPLHIDILVEEEYLVVINNVQLRKSTYSTGMGLENIKMRYSYLTERKVTVEADEQRFKVKVPLLKE